MGKRVIAFLISFCFIFEQAGFAQVAGPLGVPAYLNNFAPAADKFRPVHLRALAFDGSRNSFDLVLDRGDAKEIPAAGIRASAEKLFEYFQIGIRLPNSAFWVNLRPDSPDDVIDPLLGKTDLGKVMLAADLQLKKDMAGFTSPETPEGRRYWDELYEKADSLYGAQEITVPALTRPWIVPGEIIIQETRNGAYILKATLKVMLEQDYLKGSVQYSFEDERSRIFNDYSSELLRKLIIPGLTREVNSSRKYADLRQAYYSLIMAQWFKQSHGLTASQVAGKIGSKDLTGLTSATAWSKDQYFQAYKKSFSRGEYNRQEEVYGSYGPTVRSYFSGGMTLNAGDSITVLKDKLVSFVKIGLAGGDLIDAGSLPLPDEKQAPQPGEGKDGGKIDNSAKIKDWAMKSGLVREAAKRLGSAEPDLMIAPYLSKINEALDDVGELLRQMQVPIQDLPEEIEKDIPLRELAEKIKNEESDNPKVGEYKLRVSVAPGAEIKIDAYRKTLENDIRNLVRNAIQNTKKMNGKVEIEIKALSKGRVQISITNDAVIPREFWDKMFDLTEKDRRQMQGQMGIDNKESTGIGLPQVREQVESILRGTVYQDKKDRETLARFIIDMPAHAEPVSFDQDIQRFETGVHDIKNKLQVVIGYLELCLDLAPKDMTGQLNSLLEQQDSFLNEMGQELQIIPVKQALRGYIRQYGDRSMFVFSDTSKATFRNKVEKPVKALTVDLSDKYRERLLERLRKEADQDPDAARMLKALDDVRETNLLEFLIGEGAFNGYDAIKMLDDRTFLELLRQKGTIVARSSENKWVTVKFSLKIRGGREVLEIAIIDDGIGKASESIPGYKQWLAQRLSDKNEEYPYFGESRSGEKLVRAVLAETGLEEPYSRVPGEPGKGTTVTIAIPLEHLVLASAHKQVNKSKDGGVYFDFYQAVNGNFETVSTAGTGHLDKWFAPNEEPDTQAIRDALKGRKGIYMGVAYNGVNLSRASQADFDKVIILDINPFVGEIFMPLRAALISRAGSRAEYLGMLCSVEFSEEEIRALAGASLDAIDKVLEEKLQTQPAEKRLIAMSRTWEKIQGEFPAELRDKAKEVWFQYSRDPGKAGPSRNPFKVFQQIQSMKIEGSWLASEEDFFAIRAMSRNGDILGATGDWADTDFFRGNLSGNIEAMASPVSVIYISNIFEWWGGAFEEKMRALLSNIKSLPLDKDAVLLFNKKGRTVMLEGINLLDPDAFYESFARAYKAAEERPSPSSLSSPADDAELLDGGRIVFSAESLRKYLNEDLSRPAPQKIKDSFERLHDGVSIEMSEAAVVPEELFLSDQAFIELGELAARVWQLQTEKEPLLVWDVPAGKFIGDGHTRLAALSLLGRLKDAYPAVLLKLKAEGIPRFVKDPPRKVDKSQVRVNENLRVPLSRIKIVKVDADGVALDVEGAGRSDVLLDGGKRLEVPEDAQKKILAVRNLIEMTESGLALTISEFLNPRLARRIGVNPGQDNGYLKLSYRSALRDRIIALMEEARLDPGKNQFDAENLEVAKKEFYKLGNGFDSLSFQDFLFTLGAFIRTGKDDAVKQEAFNTAVKFGEDKKLSAIQRKSLDEFAAENGKKFDGGKKAGGIDFRALPVMASPAALAGPAAVTSIATPEALRELNRRWQEIQVAMQKEDMPYGKIKEYVDSCKKQGAARELDNAAACIAGILRMEEDRAVATTPEMEEILTNIG